MEEWRREVEGSVRFARDRHAVTIRMCRDRSWKVIGVSDEELEEGRVWRRRGASSKTAQEIDNQGFKDIRDATGVWLTSPFPSMSLLNWPVLVVSWTPFFLSCCFALAKFLLPRLREGQAGAPVCIGDDLLNTGCY